MRIKDGFLLRQVYEDYMVIPVGANSVDFKSVIRLNETGAFLFEHLKEETNEAALLEKMLGEYNVEAEIAKRDIALFLQNLESAGILG